MVIALKIDLFMPPAQFKAEMDDYVRAVRSLTAFAPGQQAYLPGGIEAERAESYRVEGIPIGDEHRELEAELRKMAPPNGRSVLTFRAPCGCAKGRMEVWGAKKVRRIKK
jgi:LDH2 family malate/lactate/ureidoglycolate dehydrogenase